MRRAALSVALAALLSACAHDAAPVPAAPPPPKAVMLCEAGSPVAAVDRKALCDAFDAMHETALPDGATRIVLMPAGQAVLSIRLSGAKLVVRRLTGGKLDIDRTVDLPAKDVQVLAAATAGDAFRRLPVAADAPTFAACKAGNIIAAESRVGTYMVALSHCVALTPLRDAANAFLNIAGERVPELKQGLEQSLD